MTYIEALDYLVMLAKASEGCWLRAYPDPASPLYRALAKAGLIRAYMAGKAEIPVDMRHLSGSPWTIGYGETEGVKENDIWTQEQAESRLRTRLAQFMIAVLKRCPILHLEPPERTVACTDLAYNIGVGGFGASSVCRRTMRQEFHAAADSFLLWNKAGGKVMRGLTVRRQTERSLYLRADQ